MVLVYNIQNIETKQVLLADAIMALNKTELFDFLRNSPQLKDDNNIQGLTEETHIFFLENEEGVVFERYISDLKSVNDFKNNFVDFLLKGKSIFQKFKEIFKDFDFKDLAKAASGAVHHQ